jgi:3-oxoadipate enol-lactonase
MLLPAGADRLWVEDSETPGPTLVLLHEGIADCRMWDPQWPAWTERCRVVRYDVRGYGRSPPPTEPYRLVATCVRCWPGWRSAVPRWSAAAWAGAPRWSTRWAEPAAVAALVLLCPGGPGYPFPDEPEIDAEYERLVAAGDEDGLVALGLREWAAAGPDGAAAQLMRSAVRAFPYEHLEVQPEPVYDRLGEICAPTVLMVGDRDRPPLVACAEAAAERISGAALVRLPGADHYPTLRIPDLVRDTVLEYAGRG